MQCQHSLGIFRSGQKTFTANKFGRLDGSKLQHFALYPNLNWKRLSRQSKVAESSQVESSTQEREVLEDVLGRIKSSDGGARLSLEEQSDVNDKLEQLEQYGKQQQPRPLENPAIFGNFNVAYSSIERAPRQSGQPAGGRFRGRLGRQIFRTTKLCQGLYQPNTVTNKVRYTLYFVGCSFPRPIWVDFILLGLVKGFVGLRGTFEALKDKADTVKINFQPPRLSLGDSLDLPIGPKSSVVITLTYVTGDVRIGKGSLGSLFVFTKGGASDDAGLDKVGLGRTTSKGWLILAAVLASLAASIRLLWASNSLLGRVATIFPALPLLFLGQAALRALLLRQ